MRLQFTSAYATRTADRALLDEPPHRLLRLAQERDRRAREPQPSVAGQVDERAGARVVAGERLLAVDVLAGLEGGVVTSAWTAG